MALDLTWVPSHAQARRRLKVEAYRQNPAWSGSIVTNAFGLRAIDQRFIQVQIPEVGLDNTFEMQKWSFDPMSGNCTLQISLMPSAAYDWDAVTEEGTAPAATNTSGGADVESPASLEASASGDVINASWDAPEQLSLTTTADWRVHDGSITDEDAVWTPMIVTGLTAQSGSLSTGSYDVRVRYTDPLGVAGPYSFVRSIAV
jgi:hypothetical protein